MSDALGTMQIDPAEVRFTQDSIALYFQPPHQSFSIREAVKKIPRNEMTPEDFPAIRVIRYRGFYSSMDNRRLWVFRNASCSSICAVRTNEMHPRLEELIANSCLFSVMKGPDFFPRVREKGMKDWNLDLFRQPSSFVQLPRNDHSTKLLNTIGAPDYKAEEHSMKPPTEVTNAEILGGMVDTCLRFLVGVLKAVGETVELVLTALYTCVVLEQNI